MTTIYTVNNKVLKNSANDKWLIKKEAPAGVMNASNAIYTSTTNAGGYPVIQVSWQCPSYPNAYNGSGKTFILVNNNSDASSASLLGYSSDTSSVGTAAISVNRMRILGTSTGTLSSGSGSYFVWRPLGSNATLEQVQAYMANVSITIVDP